MEFNLVNCINSIFGKTVKRRAAVSSSIKRPLQVAIDEKTRTNGSATGRIMSGEAKETAREERKYK